MPSILEALETICNRPGNATVAAYTEPPAQSAQQGVPSGATLHYRASLAGCDAAMDIIDQLGTDRRLVYLCIKAPRPYPALDKHWLRIYLANRLVIFRPNLTAARLGSANPRLIPHEVVSEKAWHRNSLPSQCERVRAISAAPPPIRGAVVKGKHGIAPILAGDLFLASVLLHPFKDPEGRMKGLQRALRYYQLAAYALAGIANKPIEGEQSSPGHHVASILVSRRGEILAWGVNGGHFRHAELNMTRAWHREYGETEKFEECSMVFSTLTPCEQCSGALTEARPTCCHIYYGEKDRGPHGAFGEQVSNSFDAESPKMVQLGDATNTQYLSREIQNAIAVAGRSRDNAAKRQGSAAACYLAAETELTRKDAKDRASHEEHDIKRDVLQHIRRFLNENDFAAP